MRRFLDQFLDFSLGYTGSTMEFRSMEERVPSEGVEFFFAGFSTLSNALFFASLPGRDGARVPAPASITGDSRTLLFSLLPRTFLQANGGAPFYYLRSRTELPLSS